MDFNQQQLSIMYTVYHNFNYVENQPTFKVVLTDDSSKNQYMYTINRRIENSLMLSSEAAVIPFYFST
jgi:hypothetical protein